MAAGLGFCIAWATTACSEEEDASCTKAMNHLYDKGCGLTVGDEPVTKGEAIAGCEDTKDDAKACGCGGIYQDGLNCMAGIGQGECGACPAELNDFNTCLQSCA